MLLKIASYVIVWYGQENYCKVLHKRTTWQNFDGSLYSYGVTDITVRELEKYGTQCCPNSKQERDIYISGNKSPYPSTHTVTGG